MAFHADAAGGRRRPIGGAAGGMGHSRLLGPDRREDGEVPGVIPMPTWVWDGANGLSALTLPPETWGRHPGLSLTQAGRSREMFESGIPPLTSRYRGYLEEDRRERRNAEREVERPSPVLAGDSPCAAMVAGVRAAVDLSVGVVTFSLSGGSRADPQGPLATPRRAPGRDPPGRHDRPGPRSPPAGRPRRDPAARVRPPRPAGEARPPEEDGGRRHRPRHLGRLHGRDHPPTVRTLATAASGSSGKSPSTRLTVPLDEFEGD